MSFFKDVELAPPDIVFHVTTSYNQDPSPVKCNLGVGAYRTDEGRPWVLPVVRNVEMAMAGDETLNHEYLSIDGLREYSDAASRLLLGQESKAVLQNLYCGVQSISGTGALRLAAEFLHRFHKSGTTVYISDPTWANHRGIFNHAGYSDIRTYRYYHAPTRALDFEGMIEDLQAASPGSIVILHMCAHNPTGVDPNQEQWSKIADTVQARGLFPLFDCAYQGFVTGDPDVDAWPVRHFVEKGMCLMAAQSFSKNFGLYNERTGNLTVICAKPDEALAVRSQLKKIVRAMYSNPPNHGARIVALTLGNPAFLAEWRENLRTMTTRITQMRKQLYAKLLERETPGTWHHIIDQRGMFTFTGLQAHHVEFMRNKYHIYMLSNGRINMCGLTTNNIDHVANAIHDAVTTQHTADVNGRL